MLAQRVLEVLKDAMCAVSSEELGYQVRGLLVAVSLGQGRAAGDVGEQATGAGRVRLRSPALLFVIADLSSVFCGRGR